VKVYQNCCERSRDVRRIKTCRSAQTSHCSLSISISHFLTNHPFYHHISSRYINTLSTLRDIPSRCLHHNHKINPRQAAPQARNPHKVRNPKSSNIPRTTCTPFSSAQSSNSQLIRSTRSKNLRSVQQARRRPRKQTSQSLLNLQICSLLLARVHKSTLQGSQKGVCKVGSGVLKDCSVQARSEELGAQGGT
jgi:hypothetical protein